LVLLNIAEKVADKYAGTEEGPFLARVKPAAFGSVRQTRSTQVSYLALRPSSISDLIVIAWKIRRLLLTMKSQYDDFAPP
jgi:hypothetical protein